MGLEISGKFVKSLPAESGTGKKGTWVKQSFVIETEDQYPKKICVTAWGDLCDTVDSIKPGSSVKASINLESREYNGKWYSDIKAWKIEVGGETKPETKQGKSKPSSKKVEEDPFAANDSDDDLPF